jgi:hypothetical protein
VKVLGSAVWILGALEHLPRSRVHAACLETKGQPFYGWFASESKDKSRARF